MFILDCEALNHRGHGLPVFPPDSGYQSFQQELSGMDIVVTAIGDVHIVWTTIISVSYTIKV